MRDTSRILLAILISQVSRILYHRTKKGDKYLLCNSRMAPTQSPPSGSWPPSKKAAVTLGIILGLVLLLLLVVALCKSLKKHVIRWIKDELAFDRYKHCNYCKCEQSHGHRAYPRRRFSSNSIISSLPPSNPPPVLQARFSPSPLLPEPHYLPRQDGVAISYHLSHERAGSLYHAGDNQTDNPSRVRHDEPGRAENPEPRSFEGVGETRSSWEAGNERMNYTPPYVNSARVSMEDESPHGRTSRPSRARSRGALAIKDV